LAEHVTKLARQNGELINKKNEHGISVLQIARMYQQREVVKALLDAGADDPEGAGAKFVAGTSVRDAKQDGTAFHTVMLAGASFQNVNLAQATFENVNMCNAVLFNINLSNTVIDWCSIDGMRIMGVEVKPLIEAELARRNASKSG